MPLVAASEFSQSYQRTAGGRSRRRTQNGSIKTAQHWNKIATDLSGSGHIPSGLSGLDYAQEMTLSCGGPRSISSASNIIVIPAQRRIDAGFEPFGFALFGDRAVATPVNIVTHTATLTAIAGASGYTIAYFPEIIVAAEEPVESFDRGSGLWRWQIQAEEA